MDAEYDEKAVRAAGLKEYKLNISDDGDEASLYSEAEFKWERLSDRERAYYETQAKQLPIAALRRHRITNRDAFNPVPFELFMDFSRDKRFL